MLRDMRYFAKLSKNLPIKYKIDQGYTRQVKSVMDSILNEKNKEIIPVVIGGNEKYGRLIQKQFSPIDNKKWICEYSNASESDLNLFLCNHKQYKESLTSLSEKDIKIIFQRASELLDNKYRDLMIAYTILGQGKSLFEAEVDAICELGDFWNFNSDYFETILQKQPFSPINQFNESVYNPLNGFVASITPFNFTAIGGNLATVPLFFRNTTIWKPSKNAILSNYLVYKIMIEAGMPEEAISFAPSDPQLFSNTIIKSPHLGGVLFTGSTNVFDSILENVYGNIKNYNSYPRIVGETGGKNWHFIDENMDENDLNKIADKTIQSAFGYSGQKCSACSIVYISEKDRHVFVNLLKKNIGIFKHLNSFKNYGLIDEDSFERTVKVINKIKSDSKRYKLISGGQMASSSTYFCEPTIIECSDHSDFVFNQEFFAPILAIYTYDDKMSAMKKCVSSNNYALTGSVFSKNNTFIRYSREYFKEKCGNFYVNDKSTGSVVGQQPFGGSGRSGTNDKAGDVNLLYKLFNQQTIKTGSI